MREWKLRDTVMTIFMVAVVGIMLMQMVQNDRLYDRVTTLIRAMESSPHGFTGAQGVATTQTAGSGWLVPDAEPGGAAIICYNAQPANLNPITYKDVYGAYILSRYGLVYQGLLDYNGDTLELEGVLAESWNISDDGLVITFRLKDGPVWSDGRPVTAEDVVFGFRVMMLPTVDAQRQQTYYVDCESVKALDPRTVQFTWKKKYFKSLEQSGGVPVLPRHVIDPDNLLEKDPEALASKINSWNFLWNGRQQVTCGPYLLESWDKVAQRVVLVRNERYWGLKPPLQRLVFRFIQNDDASLQALKARQLDALWLSTEQWEHQTNDPEFLKNFEKLKYLRVDAGYAYIGWNNRRKPFDDVRVRSAMSYCMPRELIIEKIFYNLRELVNGPFSPHSKQSNKSLPQWPFDPAKGRALLEEAGFKDTNNDGILDRDGKPLQFNLMMPSGSPQYEQILALFQDELSKIGVKMNIDPYEWSVFTDRLDQRNYDACILGWSGGIESDPFQIWHSSSYENKGSNHIGYSNPEADRLIVEARAEFDEDKRNAMYQKFHEIIYRDQPYTFLFTGPTLMARSKRLQNVQIDKLGVDFKEWWIRASDRRVGE
jgi:peptide/nickel transport system substrate-binding protein